MTLPVRKGKSIPLASAFGQQQELQDGCAGKCLARRLALSCLAGNVPAVWVPNSLKAYLNGYTIRPATRSLLQRSPGHSGKAL